MSDLTGLQAAFVEEYLVDFNGTRAAERAGYSGDENSLAVIAHENLRKPKIAQRIRARLNHKVMTANEALVRLSEIARGEHAQYIKADGDVDVKRMVEDGKAHLISRISDTKHGRRYEFCDMHRALQDIAKVHSLFVDITRTLNVNLENLTESQLERLAAGEDVLSVLANPGTSGA